MKEVGPSTAPLRGSAQDERMNESDDSLAYGVPTKRSVLIAGHQTSISLEPMFWRALEAAAKERGCPVNALVAEIDVARLDARQPPNLTSAIRQWLFARTSGSPA
jgi:predicted DNA-binding ribbon-helix-helix protein